jgi:hypothetical protein
MAATSRHSPRHSREWLLVPLVALSLAAVGCSHGLLPPTSFSWSVRLTSMQGGHSEHSRLPVRRIIPLPTLLSWLAGADAVLAGWLQRRPGRLGALPTWLALSAPSWLAGAAGGRWVLFDHLSG